LLYFLPEICEGTAGSSGVTACPVYFDADLRAQWLRDMIIDEKKKHLLDNEDSVVILSQVNEPFIQKYLNSLTVRVCTVPVTQVVSVMVAVIYIAMHSEMPRVQAHATGLSILALFQVVPIGRK
jgi:ABC-type maltose transport system permease subunit